jgi:hypothetical protein
MLHSLGTMGVRIEATPLMLIAKSIVVILLEDIFLSKLIKFHVYITCINDSV